MGNAFTAMWNGIRSTVSGIYNTIKGGFDQAVGFITGLASSAWNWGADIVNGIANGIRAAVGNVVDAVRSIADKIAAFLHFSVPDDGLTMNLGVNPLLQFGLDETREALCRNILNDLSVIRYVPFDSDTIGNPALDLGDVLLFSGGQAGDGQMACVTAFTCRIGGKHSLKCVEKNPRLAGAKSKSDKNISGLLNQIEAGKLGIHTFTNASAYRIWGAECPGD